MGFTLIELIVVMVLLGIISAVVFPRLDGVFSYQNATFHSSLNSSLKLSQKTALAQHALSVYWRLDRLSDDVWQVSIMTDDDPDDATPPIGGVSGTIVTGESLLIMYNQLGDMIRVTESPTVTLSYPSSAAAVDASLQLTDANGVLCVSLTGYSYAESCR